MNKKNQLQQVLSDYEAENRRRRSREAIVSLFVVVPIVVAVIVIGFHAFS